MISLRKILVASALTGLTLSPSISTAQAGPLLEHSSAEPAVQVHEGRATASAVQTAALEPVELSDESMDSISAGAFEALIVRDALILKHYCNLDCLKPPSER